MSPIEIEKEILKEQYYDTIKDDWPASLDDKFETLWNNNYIYTFFKNHFETSSSIYFGDSIINSGNITYTHTSDELLIK